nr:Rv3235 family protein [Pseudarthrobacter sp. NamE2]
MSAVTPIRAAQGRTSTTPGTLRAAGQEGRQRQPEQPRSGIAGIARPPVLRSADPDAEVRAIIRGTIQAAMEVLAGIRPVHQLARRLDPRSLANLQHRAALIRREFVRTGNPVLARLHRNSTVRSVRVCEVADGIFEASAVVIDDIRARAVAVRLERAKQVWRVTELVIG